jgi:hypothetical protein
MLTPLQTEGKIMKDKMMLFMGNRRIPRTTSRAVATFSQ